MAMTNVIDSSVELARIFPPEAILVGLENTSKLALIAALGE
jgi:hypothetical protein